MPYRAVFAAFLLFATSVSAADEVSKLKLKSEKVKSEIDKLDSGSSKITSPCSRHADCAAVEVGVKPCGGPWGFKVYSKKNVRASVLEKKAAELASLDRELNRAEALMSDCSVELPPEPKCTKSRTNPKDPGVCVDSAKNLK